MKEEVDQKSGILSARSQSASSTATSAHFPPPLPLPSHQLPQQQTQQLQQQQQQQQPQPYNTPNSRLASLPATSSLGLPNVLSQTKYEPFKVPPPSSQEYQHRTSSPHIHNASLPPYDFGYPQLGTGVAADQQQQQQQQQTSHLNSTLPPPAPGLNLAQAPSIQVDIPDGTRQQTHLNGRESASHHKDAESPIEGEGASDGRMLLVESGAAARRGEGEDPEEHDNVTEHYRGASSGIPSLHALRHHSDDGPAHASRRPRAYSTSASHSRGGQIDYYAHTSPEYPRNVVGYGDSLRTQADERGVFIEDEREHFTLPPIRLLSSHSIGDGINSPNFPVHVPKGLFDRLIS